MTGRVFILEAGQTPWEPYAMDGEPDEFGAQVKYLRRPGQGDSDIDHCGIWKGTRETLPPRLKSEYESTETVLILKGELLIELEDGTAHTLKAGDAMSFEQGSTAYWTILSDEFEEFFIWTPRAT